MSKSKSGNQTLLPQSEKRLYALAFQAFTAAFDEGYSKGKADLVNETAVQLVGLGEQFFIDVPRRDVVSDEWRRHISRFQQCGRVAALAAHRRGEARLKLLETDPAAAWRWTVNLVADD